MGLWWNDSLELIMIKEDTKILREMDFIARSLISKRQSRPESRYERAIEHIRGNVVYSTDPKERIAPTARYL